MPIYEYQCENCGHRSEALQKMSDPPLTTCDECGGSLKKLLSAPAFQFKGSGWYVTDYANKSGGEKASDGGDSKADKSTSDTSSGSNKDSSSAKSSSSKSDSGSSKTSSASNS